MNTGRSVFAQLLAIVPFNHFEHLVDKHQSNGNPPIFSINRK